MRKGLIEDRLQASIKFDAINGDSFERGVVAGQITEAIGVIKVLREQIMILTRDREAIK